MGSPDCCMAGVLVSGKSELVWALVLSWLLLEGIIDARRSSLCSKNNQTHAAARYDAVGE